ncbi:MAG: AraC family transcriptional regulator [Epulopiscium sp.]|nr:AraC family transcriptional regulator [Candidatus Epulonipiscium sp.]
MKKNLQSSFNTRQYMLSKDFEIYYYSDSQLPPVAPHSHDYYEFYFFLEGNMEINIAGHRYPIKPGDFFLIPPGTNHYPSFLNHELPYRRFVLWISQDYCNQLLKISPSYVYMMQYVSTTKNYIFHNDVISFNSIQSMIFRLIEEIKNERFGKEAEVSLQLNSLLLHLNRLVYEKNHNKVKTTNKPLYLNICNYIADNLSGDLSLDCLEKEFYVNKFYIAHEFKNNIGISIHQYVTKKRLHACKDVILSNQSITKVFRLYGFNDYSTFYRAFKKEYGISPREYKEMYPSIDS